MRTIVDIVRVNIRRYRLEQNLTLEALAARSGVSHDYVSKLERGEKKNPSLIVVAKLAKGLGVTIDKLVV